MEYRKASANDIELLMELRADMLRTVNDLSGEYEFTAELIDNSREYFLKGDQTTVLALDDGKAAGCASISYFHVMPTFAHAAGKRAHIMNVYTRAGYRRRGIAKKLVTMLIDEAKEKGVSEIALDATISGRPLYEALGFRASDEYMAMNINSERI